MKNQAATASPGEREEISFPELAHCTISNAKTSTKNNETNKEQETMAKTQGRKQSVETVFKEAQI